MNSFFVRERRRMRKKPRHPAQSIAADAAHLRWEVKRDGANDKLLYGAEFGLYSDFECTNLIENSIDYDNGLYYFPGLTLDSTYYLKELKAPANYKLDEIILY